MYWDMMDTPVGPLRLAADDNGLRYIAFRHERHPVAFGADWERAPARFAEPKRQFDEYFRGRRRRFDLRLAPIGTEFQLAVWRALAGIPYGETTSYSRLATHLGRPNAVRAVGAANGRNPLPIVLPCHRVIGANGDLTGFGGGIEVKGWLLAHEGAREGDLFVPGTQVGATSVATKDLRQPHSGRG